MIKIYLDWNVMAGMKANRFPDISEILSQKNRFFIPYSTSHISDLTSSINDHNHSNLILDEDLKFISNLTKDNCFFNNIKNIILEKRNPKDILNNKIITEKFTFEGILESMKIDDSSTKLVDLMVDFLKAVNLNVLISDNLDLKNTTVNIFPNFENDLTLYGLMNSILELFDNMNEKEDYKYLREVVQKMGINSSHFSPGKNPFELIKKFNSTKNITEEILEKNLDGIKTGPLWFNNIIAKYVTLDMYGYKADKIKVTDKEKKTFKNTTDDANHSAFASFCDIYITCDDKNYHKTKAVYNELGISTLVFKPNEFTNYYNNNLSTTSVVGHFSDMIKLLEEPIFHNFDNEDGSYFGKIAISKKILFDFFNKIFVPENDNDENNIYLILSKYFPNNDFQFVAYIEIENLITGLHEVLGEDIFGNNSFNENEVIDDIWIGRKWNLESCSIALVRINGYFQLYYNQILVSNPDKL